MTRGLEIRISYPGRDKDFARCNYGETRDVYKF